MADAAHQPAAHLRPGAALAVVVALLTAYNVARSTVVPDGVHLATNVAMAGLVVAVGAAAGLGTAALGLDPAFLGAGVRLGLLGAGVVTAVLLIAAAVPATRGYFEDDRADVSLLTMLVRVVFVIPIGTVLVEELVFRGVVFALLWRLVSPLRTVVLGSVLFGLWHVAPTWIGERDLGLSSRLGAAAGTLLATFAAGVAFNELRRRSGHLAAPVIVHVAANSGAFALAWVLR